MYNVERLKDFALNDVASILRIPKEISEKIFYLGRLLQLYLSIRFRMKTEPDKVNDFFKKAEFYIDKIMK